jgi:hypothetical protein
MNKAELISQTRNAFEFIQKFYFEVSYLIKEMEGLLSEEDEEFIIGRTSGYQVVARSSNGLEPSQIEMWMCKKLAVFFLPRTMTKIVKGQTVTEFKQNPKIIYLRFILDDKDLVEPKIFFGVLYDFVKKGGEWPSKIEQLMAHIEYQEAKVFDGSGEIQYEDGYISFKGKLNSINLYDINNSQDIAEKLIAPALKIFREA